MNSDKVRSSAQATLDGSIPFPQIVGNLIADGVEYYYVDFASKSFTFYSATGASVNVPLSFEGLPLIAENFDATELRKAILDSQQNSQKFQRFCQRATSAGVQGYFAFLRGQRVTYFGRQGDQHTEWFPGARPSNA
jgi:uncharacterized protein YbcV (DUF1398 family)